MDGHFGDKIGDSMNNVSEPMRNYKDISYELAALTKKDSHYNNERNHWKRITGVRSRYPNAQHILESRKSNQIDQTEDILVKNFCEGEAMRYAAGVDPKLENQKINQSRWEN